MSKSKSPRRAYKPKYDQLPSGIAGIAIANELNPAHGGFVTRQTGRYFAAMLAGGDWTPHQMNEIILGLNIAQQVLKLYPEYVTPANGKAAGDMLTVVQSIRKRKERTGKYGVSGDELALLRSATVELDKLLASVSLARIARCEEIVFTWHRKNGAYKYSEGVGA